MRILVVCETATCGALSLGCLGGPLKRALSVAGVPVARVSRAGHPTLLAAGGRAASTQSGIVAAGVGG